MATIRRKEGKRGVTYDVQIRIRPYPATNGSFKKLTDAKRWAEKTETEMREGRYGMISESRKKTLSEAIERYQKYVLPRVIKSNRAHILVWWDKLIGKRSLKEITPALIAEIRDKYLYEEINGKKKAPATVVKYLITLSHVMSMCVNEWQWLEANPVAKVSKPTVSNCRTRFLDDSERIRLLQACQASKNPYLYTIVVLALSLGFRRSELLNLKWSDVDWERERIVLRETKNGEVRVLPLVGYCKQLLKELEQSRKMNSFLLFPGTDPKRPVDFRSAWLVAVKNAKLEDVNFHTLRHSFASYCIMGGSSLTEIGDLMGNKSVTKRYCHLSDAYRKDVVVSMNEKIFGGQ